jgi:hypothetical protein
VTPDRIEAVGHALEACPVACALHIESRPVVSDLERELTVGLRQRDARARGRAYLATLFNASSTQK